MNMNILSFLFGGFVSSFVISLYFYHKCYKRDLDELTKELNQQFAEHRNFLIKVHNMDKKNLLTMYKNILVDQLENDIANIWDVKPGAMVAANPDCIDKHALDNADEKYFKTHDAIVNQSENMLKYIFSKYNLNLDK